MGLRSPPEGVKEVPLYYSNPDVIYANEFPAPRFGQGCFAAALDAVYAAVCFLRHACQCQQLLCIWSQCLYVDHILMYMVDAVLGWRGANMCMEPC